MSLTPEILTFIGAIVAVAGWLFRLEGRVNSNAQSIADLTHSFAAAEAKAEAEARAHRSTADALIRVEERLKYITEVLERHYGVASL